MRARIVLDRFAVSTEYRYIMGGALRIKRCQCQRNPSKVLHGYTSAISARPSMRPVNLPRPTSRLEVRRPASSPERRYPKVQPWYCRFENTPVHHCPKTPGCSRSMASGLLAVVLRKIQGRNRPVLDRWRARRSYRKQVVSAYNLCPARVFISTHTGSQYG